MIAATDLLNRAFTAWATLGFLLNVRPNRFLLLLWEFFFFLCLVNFNRFPKPGVERTSVHTACKFSP